MSRVGVFSQLYRVEPATDEPVSNNPEEWFTNANVVESAPEIIDKEAWDEFCDRYETRSDYAVTSEDIDATSFPKKVHTTLHGFSQYDSDTHNDDYYRMNKTHVLRDEEKLIDFFNFVSMATEPFMVYHSGCDNHWPRAETMLSPSLHTEENHDLFRIISANGNTMIQKVSVSLDDAEMFATPSDTSSAPERVSQNQLP